MGTKFGHGGVALAAPFQCVARCHSRPRRGWSCGCGGGRCDQPIRGHGDRRDRLALPTQAAPQGKSSTTSWSRPSAVQSSTNATASKKASPKRAAKKATPLRPPPFKAPPQEVQIRRTNSLPTMKSPPMALSIHGRPHQSFHPNGYRHPVVEPPRAPLIPDNPRGDEPEPARLLSRSHSWPVRKEWLTRWPLTLIVFGRSNSDSCLWERSWGEHMDYRDSLIASS